MVRIRQNVAFACLSAAALRRPKSANEGDSYENQNGSADCYDDHRIPLIAVWTKLSDAKTSYSLDLVR